MPAEPESVADLAPEVAQRHFGLFAGLAAAFICVLYLLLLNPYWHYTSDSALYLTLGRNLCEGRGYVFSGIAHNKVPGGMPYLLSALLHVSHRFLWLNAVQCLGVLTALLVLYFALRQMADRATAVLVVLLTGILFWVHEYATALMSEGPFFVLSNLAVLLLMLFVNSRGGRCRALLLVGLCAMWVLAFWYRVVACFWIGPFLFALVLAVRRPLWDRILSAAVVAAVIVASFAVYWRWSPPAQKSTGQTVTTSESVPDAAYRLHPFAWEEHGPRILHIPRRFLLVLCPPWQAAAGWLVPRVLAEALAWACFAIVVLGGYRAMRRGQAFLAGSILFVGPFLFWDTGNKATTGRYVIAIAPFVILLFLLGMEGAGEFLGSRMRLRRGRKLLVFLGITAVLVPNLALLLGDIWVQRQRDFYAVYRGGGYAELMGIAKWLSAQEVREPVVVGDLNAWRVLTCLTECRVVGLPEDVNPASPDFASKAADFARAHGTRYIVSFDAQQPWPIWHIPTHLPGGAAPGRHWQLCECPAEDGALRPVQTEPACRWPTSIPETGGKQPAR